MSIYWTVSCVSRWHAGKSLVNRGFLVGGDWNHGMDYDFPMKLGMSSSQLTPSFFRGVGVETC